MPRSLNRTPGSVLINRTARASIRDAGHLEAHLRKQLRQGLVAGHVEDADGSEHGYAFNMFLGDG
jgi:hypothetical protein